MLQSLCVHWKKFPTKCWSHLSMFRMCSQQSLEVKSAWLSNGKAQEICRFRHLNITTSHKSGEHAHKLLQTGLFNLSHTINKKRRMYNKRTADIEEIDPELNRKFWTWYLTDCIPFVYESEKHPRYYTDNRISIPIPANCNAILYDGINRFNSHSTHMFMLLLTEKRYCVCKPYATDEKLVRTVAGFLQGYCCIPSNAQELENYCMIGHFYYDIIRFWYCVALLALSSDSAALDCLTRLAHTLMEQGPGDLHVLYRILLLLPEQSSLNGLRQELSDYYKNTFQLYSRPMVGKSRDSLSWWFWMEPIFSFYF